MDKPSTAADASKETQPWTLPGAFPVFYRVKFEIVTAAFLGVEERRLATAKLCRTKVKIWNK
jgi:hypothetical protein